MNKDTEQVSQGTEQKRQGREQTAQSIDLTDIKVAIARIEENVKSIKSDVSEIRDSTDELTRDLGVNGNRVTAVETKTANLAIFQGVFSVIIGAIATYLGVQK
jgi:chromosome segregation ATPase